MKELNHLLKFISKEKLLTPYGEKLFQQLNAKCLEAETEGSKELPFSHSQDLSDNDLMKGASKIR